MKDGEKLIKGIIYKSTIEKAPKFTDLIGEGIAELDEGIFIKYWDDGSMHQSKLSNLKDPEDPYFFSTSLNGAKVDTYDLDRLPADYKKYKSDLLIKATKALKDSLKKDSNMKKYKIGSRIITADSATKALEIHKLLDSKVKDSSIKLFGSDAWDDDTAAKIAREHHLQVETTYDQNRRRWINTFKGSRSDIWHMLDDMFVPMRRNSLSDKIKDSKVKDVRWDELERAIFNEYDGEPHSEIGYDNNLRGFSSRTDASKCADFLEKKFPSLDFNVVNHNGWEIWVKGNIRDSISDESIDELSEEEKKAIEDYKRAIAETNDPKMLKLFAHILKEETEHLEELQTGEMEDSIKDSTLCLYGNHMFSKGVAEDMADGYNLKVTTDAYCNEFKGKRKDIEEMLDDYLSPSEARELKKKITG